MTATLLSVCRSRGEEAQTPCSVLTREEPPNLTSAPTAQPNPWFLWQLADSAFPTGGFAHSGGLEAAWQQGEVPRQELNRFIETSLIQSARGAIPFLTAAHAEPVRLADFDRHCDAFLSNHVANRASRQQGQSLLMTCERAFGGASVVALRQRLGDSELLGHLAPVFGAVMRNLRLNCEITARLFLFLQLRGLVASAVRLNILGPLEAQALQHTLIPAAEAAAILGLSLGLDDLAQSAPVLDLLQGAQDRLYSRLFQS